jgi:hypothetical protein
MTAATDNAGLRQEGRIVKGIKTKEHANDAETKFKAARPSQPESADEGAHS